MIYSVLKVSIICTNIIAGCSASCFIKNKLSNQITAWFKLLKLLIVWVFVQTLKIPAHK